MYLEFWLRHKKQDLTGLLIFDWVDTLAKVLPSYLIFSFQKISLKGE
jgi:hypothetical protein